MILIIYNVQDKKNGNVFYECLNYSSKNMKLLFSHIHKKYKIIDTNDIRHKKIGMNFFHKNKKTKTSFEVLSKLLNFFIFKRYCPFHETLPSSSGFMKQTVFLFISYILFYSPAFEPALLSKKIVLRGCFKIQRFVSNYLVDKSEITKLQNST